MTKKKYENAVDHLQAIHTWCSFGTEQVIQTIHWKDYPIIQQWMTEVLDVLEELKPDFGDKRKPASHTSAAGAKIRQDFLNNWRREKTCLRCRRKDTK